MIVPPRPALANGRVRHVGDPVAFVVAETAAAARDAAEQVVVDYTPLPCVVDAVAALAPDAPPLWDTGNQSFRFQTRRPGGGAGGDSPRAAHVVEIEVVNNRLVIAPIETRAAIGRCDERHVRPVRHRRQRSRDPRPACRQRVPLPPRCMSGLGARRRRRLRHQELPLSGMGDAALGRPPPRTARSNGSRTVPRILSPPPRAATTSPAPAWRLDADGRFLALDVSTIAGLGAYMSGGGPGSSTNAPATAMGGGYVIPAIFMDVRAAFTNTAPIDAYRGAGKPEANYLIERLIDKAARQCGFDPIELRRRNLIASFPYQKALGSMVDCGRFAANIDDVLALADHAGFAAAPRRQRSAGQATRHRRRLLSGNRARCPERGRGNPVRCRRHRDDPGRHAKQRPGPRDDPIPRSPPTCLGLPLSQFRYIQADTAEIPEGNGHGGARSMHMGGAALHRAAQQVIDKGKPVAARLLQASPDQITFAAGRVHRR